MHAERSCSIEQLIADAQAEERHGRRDAARALYERALELIARPDDSALAADVLRWIARTHQVDGSLDAALAACEAALVAARESGSEATIGLVMNQRASVLVSQGRLDDAERLYEEIRARALMVGEAKLAAMTAQNLGVIANIRGDHARALRHYEASLADYRALGLARDVVVALNNLGMLQTHMQRWVEAERAFAEAAQVSAGLGDLSARMLIDVNLAGLWVARGEYAKARAACDDAFELSRQTGDTHTHGEMYKFYGIIERESGDLPRAEEYFDRAQRIATERQDLLLQGEIARERAELFRRQGRNRDTLIGLNLAHRCFNELRARRDLAEVGRRIGHLESEFLDVVRRWGDSIESKDRYTQGHCERVADIACALAARSAMHEQELFWFRIGALLHDVGKLVIPPEVLNKPGKLTPEDWELVKRHPSAGVEMLADIEFPWDVRPMVESHHERWDGRGYPHGLAGESIPLTARMLCIADVYDALTTERSYKRAWSHDEAMQIMRKDAGSQFDPELLTLFEEVMREGLPSAAVAPAPERVAAPDDHVPESQKDDLTGVVLRRSFVDRFSSLLAARDEGHLASLLVIDIDHFKLVNDTYGHLQGDDVLRCVADVLIQHVPAGGLVGRYAGDEFVVMLAGLGADGARAVAELLRVEVARARCALRGRAGGTVGVTLSIGVATAPDHGTDFETLFGAADRALYESKRRGRDGVMVATVGGAAMPELRLEVERFVGRGDEVRRLVQLLERSCERDPQIVALSGEAGIGKTTLLRELGPEVRLRGGQSVIGRCLEADVKPPYGPWASVIAALRPIGSSHADRRWTELPHLVPSLGLGPETRRDEGSRYVLFQEIAEYLRAASEARPLVIVLDDMQWADGATWDVLEYLLPQLRDERIFFCLTIRAEDVAAETLERRRRLSRNERFHGLTLSRLSSDDLQEWMAGVFHNDELARDLAAFLYQQTEGNPLLVVQMLRTLIEDGAIANEGQRWRWRQSAELRVPVGVSDLFARRLERLTPGARAMLTTAAAIGRNFDLDLLMEASGETEDAALDAVDEGVAAHVVRPTPDGNGDRYAFTHALLVDALVRAVTPRRVRRVHERIAETLERRRPEAIDEIAVHYAQSGNNERAYHYLMLAALRAATLYAHDEAASLCTLALRHATSPEQVAEAQRRLAAVQEAAGRYAEAERLTDELLSADDPDPVRRLGMRRQRERLRTLQGRPPQDTIEECRLLLGEAEALDAEGECVALLTMISQAHSRAGDSAAAERIARECVERAEKGSDNRLLAEALMRLATTLLERDGEEARRIYEHALTIFVTLADRRGQARCHMNTGIAWSRAGHATTAEEAITRSYELSRSAHAPDLAALASLNLGVMAMKSGRYDVAKARFEEALRLCMQIQSGPHRLAALYNIAHLARETGDAAAALTTYEETAALARALGHVEVEIGASAGAGLASLALGDVPNARRAASSMERLLGDRDDWWFQGRELVEALRVQVALARDVPSLAEEQFHAAVARAEASDLYGAAWLVAECARPLAAAGLVGVWDVVEKYAPRVDALGFVPLSARFAAMRRDEVSSDV